MKQQEVDLTINYLVEKISPYLIILFGSTLTGKITSDSDVDLAFLSGHNHTAYDSFMVSQELADMLGREVDLVDLSKSSTVFQARVMSTGKVIYCSDETKRMLFHMLALKKYARLNEERRVVMNKMVKGGPI